MTDHLDVAPSTAPSRDGSKIAISVALLVGLAGGVVVGRVTHPDRDAPPSRPAASTLPAASDAERAGRELTGWQDAVIVPIDDDGGARPPWPTLQAHRALVPSASPDQSAADRDFLGWACVGLWVYAAKIEPTIGLLDGALAMSSQPKQAPAGNAGVRLGPAASILWIDSYLPQNRPTHPNDQPGRPQDVTIADYYASTFLVLRQHWGELTKRMGQLTPADKERVRAFLTAFWSASPKGLDEYTNGHTGL